MALLNYSAAPLPWCNLSPAELLMGRQLQTTVPVTDTQRIPKWPYLLSWKESSRGNRQAVMTVVTEHICKVHWRMKKMCGSQQETRWSRDKLEAKLIPQDPTMWTSHLVK